MPGAQIRWLTSHSPTSASSSANVSTNLRSMSLRDRIDDDGSAVGHDLAHGLAHLRGVEAHHHDGIGLHQARILDHPVDRVAPRFLEHLGVFHDLTAGEGAQAGHDVASETAAAHDDAEDLALGFPDSMPGDIFG